MPTQLKNSGHSHSEDKKLLLELLTDIEEQLRLLVFENRQRFRREFQPLLPGPWEEVKTRFELARLQIQGDDFDWQYVEGVGLTSGTLLWKKGVLDAAKGSGVWSRILGVCNAVLGSLTGVVPALEFVKEYKDCIEACLRVIRVPGGE